VTILAFIAVGLLLFLAVIGLLGAVRGTPVDHVEGFDGDKRPDVRDPLFRRTMEFATGTRLCEGHSVQTAINGDGTYPKLWEDLRGARESITMQMYYCKPGRMANELREILIERATAGVRVLFLYDAFGTSLKDDYFRPMRIAGVEARPFRPVNFTNLHKVHHRAHIRVVVVDGRIGWTGGFGIDDKWYGDGRSKDQWRDSNIRFTGPCVAQLQAAFTACWAEASHALLVGDTLFPPIESGEGALAAVMHNSPSVGSTPAERFFALSIECARKKLYITNSYFVPDPEFRAMLVAAAQRGVDVRVLTTGPETDIKTTLNAGRARYEELLAGGVRIYEYQPTMLHAKTLVVDGYWAAVGSMNADNRSMSFNEETVLLSLDEGVAAAVEGQFLDDIEYSLEVKYEEFKQRGLWPRLVEMACYSVWRVL
jgi:cardiolipin synthase